MINTFLKIKRDAYIRTIGLTWQVGQAALIYDCRLLLLP